MNLLCGILKIRLLAARLLSQERVNGISRVADD
jgi:hypothetical protein